MVPSRPGWRRRTSAAGLQDGRPCGECALASAACAISPTPPALPTSTLPTTFLSLPAAASLPTTVASAAFRRSARCCDAAARAAAAISAAACSRATNAACTSSKSAAPIGA